MSLDALQLQFIQNIAHGSSLVGAPRMPPHLLSCGALRHAKEATDFRRMITEEL
jgi:hypothetical protein